MTPEQVPQGLAETAAKAIHAYHFPDEVCDAFVCGFSCEADARIALATQVLPVHERQVREQVAKEIEARAAEQWTIVNETPGVQEGKALPPAGPFVRAHAYDAAARIARGRDDAE